METPTASARPHVEALLSFASERARGFEGEILLSNKSHLHCVAAAGLFRVPRCLQALLLLTDAGLSLEAKTICRTLVELAIVACWMGSDEERVWLVWERLFGGEARRVVQFLGGSKLRACTPPA